MKLGSLTLTRLSRVLCQRQGQARHAQQREGLLLCLRDRDGQLGLGEASPLPGYSVDSIAECEAALSHVSLSDVEQCLQSEVSWWERLGSVGGLLPKNLPAARFALETAALDLACAQGGLSPFQLLETKPHQALRVNALVQDAGACSPAHALALLATLRTDTLKIKLAKQPARALDLVRVLSKAPGIKLRCDANRALDERSLTELLPALASLDLEFLEEPCVPELWPSLPSFRPAIALDESLQGTRPAQLAELVARSQASVLVLKPMALGGFCQCRALAATAAKLGLKVVVTHLFDGPVAFEATSALALMTHSQDLAAGLAPHAGLEAWAHITESASARFPEAVRFERRLIPFASQLLEAP